MTTTLTATQVDELKRLKACFPFRMVFGCVKPDTGEFRQYAVATRHKVNRLTREGWMVFQLG